MAALATSSSHLLARQFVDGDRSSGVGEANLAASTTHRYLDFQKQLLFDFAGEIPASLGKLISLKRLSLDNNQLTGECFGLPRSFEDDPQPRGTFSNTFVVHPEARHMPENRLLLEICQMFACL